MLALSASLLASAAWAGDDPAGPPTPGEGVTAIEPADGAAATVTVPAPAEERPGATPGPAAPAADAPGAAGPRPLLRADGAIVATTESPLQRAALRWRGHISFYADKFHGRRTACGTTFDNAALTMAHTSLPCGTQVRVTNAGNGRSVVVHVTDRGPNIGARIADVTRAAARRLGFVQRGTTIATLAVVPTPRATAPDDRDRDRY